MQRSNKQEEFEKSLKPNLQIKGSKGKHIEERMQELHVPAASVSVVSKEATFHASYGAASSTTEKPPIFQAGSISKTVNAVLAMKLLVESGKVGLDDDVNKYLIGWQVPNSFAEKVTLRRLLSHTAGTNIGGFYGYASNHHQFPTATDILKGNTEIDPEIRPPIEPVDGKPNVPPIEVITEPGTKESYSGGGTTIIQKLIEDVMGQPYAQLAEQHIFMPLGMRSSTFEQQLPGKTQLNIQPGHDKEGNELNGKWRILPELGAGGLWTTAEDLSKFAKGMLDALDGKCPNFISQETAKKMLEQQPNSSFGLGFALFEIGGKKAFGHDGINVGYHSTLVVLPEEKVIISIMANGDQGHKLHDECKRSLFNTYQWAKYKQIEKEVVELDHQELKPCIGKFQFKLSGKQISATLHCSDSKLYLRIPYPSLTTSKETKDIELIPESSRAFFNVEDDMMISFNEDHSKMTFWGIECHRVEKEHLLTSSPLTAFHNPQKKQSDTEAELPRFDKKQTS